MIAVEQIICKIRVQSVIVALKSPSSDNASLCTLNTETAILASAVIFST